jgi:hypothetical protein
MDIRSGECDGGNLEDCILGKDLAVENEWRPLHGQDVQVVVQDFPISRNPQQIAIPVAGFLKVTNRNEYYAYLAFYRVHGHPLLTLVWPEEALLTLARVKHHDKVF